MGFFDQGNTQLEVAWFSVLALLSFFCFPFGIRLSRRFPQIVAAKLVPVLCLLLAYENIVLALSHVLPDDSALVRIGRTTRAAVIPMFLVVMFEVAYAVHKRRSVKFCGIVFDQGHRRSVEPCSWFLRNFVRIVAVVLFVLGILVNYDAIVGNDDKAGGTGLVDTQDASAHLLLALLPTTCMAVIALYIALYMWKYGNDASIVVQSTVCNGWIFLFLGSLALLAGQVPPESIFRVANESGQVLLLLSLIAIGREIGKEIQAADDFSSFLEKENELAGQEQGGDSSSVFSTVSTAVERKKPPDPSSSGLRGERAADDSLPAAVTAERGRGRELMAGGSRKEIEDVEIYKSDNAVNRGGGGAGVDERDRSNIDDVLSTWERRPSRTTSLSGIFIGNPNRHGGGGAALLSNLGNNGFADLGRFDSGESGGDVQALPLTQRAGPGREGVKTSGDGGNSGGGEGGRRGNDPFPPVSMLGTPSSFSSSGGDLGGGAVDRKRSVGIRRSRGVDVV